MADLQNAKTNQVKDVANVVMFWFWKKTQLVLSSLEGNSPLPAINWMRVSKGEVFVAASWSRLSFEELKMHLVFLSQAFVRIFLWNLQDMPDGRNSLYRDWNKIYHVLVSSSQPLFDSIRVYTYHIYIQCIWLYTSYSSIFCIYELITLHFGTPSEYLFCHEFFLCLFKKASTNGSPSNSQSNANEACPESRNTDSMGRSVYFPCMYHINKSTIIV